MKEQEVKEKGIVKIARAESKHLRISAQKVNSVAKIIRGHSVKDATNTLKFLTKKAAFLILKSINSAAASAKAKGMNTDKLFVSKIDIGKGAFIKRGRPVSRGSYHPILKKTSHIFVELEEKE